MMKQHNVYVNRMLLLTLIVFVFGQVAISGLYAATLGTLSTNQLIVISELSLLLIPTISCLKNNIDVTDCFRIRRIRVDAAAIIVLMTISLYPFLTILNAISLLFVSQGDSSALATQTAFGSLPAGILFFALVPAIVEETVFRGYFFYEYRRNGFVPVMILSALIFAGFHLNINQFFYAFAMGIYTSFVLAATDSLIATMLVHFTINTVGMMAAYSMQNSATSVVDSSEALEQYREMFSFQTPQMLAGVVVAFVIIAVLSLSVVYLCYRWLLRVTGRGEAIRNMLSKDAPRTKISEIVSPTFIITLLMIAGYMILTEVASHYIQYV